MSTIAVTTIQTANGTTNLVAQTGNTTSASITVAAAIPSITFNSNSSTTAMFVANNGNIGMGNIVPAVKLHITGTMAATGDVYSSYTSDRNLKTNITIIPDALEKVNSISGYTFDWADGRDLSVFKLREAGVLAQEIQTVLPEAVTLKESGYLGVHYDQLIPLLIEAIKDLKREIEEIKKAR